MTDDLRFPIGPFVPPRDVSPAARLSLVEIVARTPVDLRTAVSGLSEAQLDTPYRPGGWTVRQVVHHVPDSHMNAYIRIKMALTEDVPTIKPYDEERWAELADSRTTPVAVSLSLLEAVHHRLDLVLRAMTAADFAREYAHPALGRNSLDFMLGLYAWHGAHHVAHITRLREREGWAGTSD